ncbi:CHY zinc finger protein [Pseudonocardia sp. HH130629-09]|uniref:CHY zinc finger protein n=1 Tax=Pseudonocardia sp. HH130629-09 TaxID=1641402 RepID=UPI0039C921C2
MQISGLHLAVFARRCERGGPVDPGRPAGRSVPAEPVPGHLGGIAARSCGTPGAGHAGGACVRAPARRGRAARLPDGDRATSSGPCTPWARRGGDDLPDGGPDRGGGWGGAGTRPGPGTDRRGGAGSRPARRPRGRRARRGDGRGPTAATRPGWRRPPRSSCAGGPVWSSPTGCVRRPPRSAFRCCDRYYPCFRCHAAHSDHPIRRWPSDERGCRAILCGVCRSELRIDDYARLGSRPGCGAPFNPRCRPHTRPATATPAAPGPRRSPRRPTWSRRSSTSHRR